MKSFRMRLLWTLLFAAICHLAIGALVLRAQPTECEKCKNYMFEGEMDGQYNEEEVAFDVLIVDGCQYLVCGQSDEPVGNFGGTITKLDQTGATVWSNTYGDFDVSRFVAIDKSYDVVIQNGEPVDVEMYVAVGQKHSPDTEFSVVKVRDDGDLIWASRFFIDGDLLPATRQPLDVHDVVSDGDAHYVIGSVHGEYEGMFIVEIRDQDGQLGWNWVYCNSDSDLVGEKNTEGAAITASDGRLFATGWDRISMPSSPSNYGDVGFYVEINPANGFVVRPPIHFDFSNGISPDQSYPQDLWVSATGGQEEVVIVGNLAVADAINTPHGGFITRFDPNTAQWTARLVHATKHSTYAVEVRGITGVQNRPGRWGICGVTNNTEFFPDIKSAFMLRFTDDWLSESAIFGTMGPNARSESFFNGIANRWGDVTVLPFDIDYGFIAVGGIRDDWPNNPSMNQYYVKPNKYIRPVGDCETSEGCALAAYNVEVENFDFELENYFRPLPLQSQVDTYETTLICDELFDQSGSFLCKQSAPEFGEPIVGEAGNLFEGQLTRTQILASEGLEMKLISRLEIPIVLSVFNSIGARVHSEIVDAAAGENTFVVSSDSWPAGAYFIQAQALDTSVSLQFVVIR